MNRTKQHPTALKDRIQRLSVGFLVAILVTACSNTRERTDEVKLRQYYIKGEQLYLKRCSNCHQKDGSGLGRLYPPLNTSDYMKDRRNEVICLIRNGKTGEITVNGTMYNMTMPAQPELTDLEVAEIATYIYNNWSHQGGLIDVKETSSVLNNCD